MNSRAPTYEGEAVDRALARARKQVVVRAGMSVLVIAVATWAIYDFRHNLAYFFYGGDLVDVGDVRALRASGVEALPARPGSYVRLQNLIVSRDEVRTRSYRFFYCPIYRVVVRTARPLPDGSVRVAQAEVPAGLEYLIEQRKVFPEDFARHFDAEGWLRPLREAPGWDAGLKEWVTHDLRLSDREVDASFALLDGETPRGQYWALIVLVSAILATVGSATSLVVAARAMRRLQAKTQ